MIVPRSKKVIGLTLSWLKIILRISRCKFHQHLTRCFYTRRSLKFKIQSSCQYLFALLGSLRVEAMRKMLMKLTPEVLATRL